MFEKYNLNSLREIIRRLEKENDRLKQLLKLSDISYQDKNFDYEDDDYDINQADRIKEEVITEKIARAFYNYFYGRKDVYAKRGSKGGYFPQCYNRWNEICPKYRGIKMRCGECKNNKYVGLTLNAIINHLNGYKEDCSDVIGLYPLLEDNKCRFIVFDFDNHEKMLEDAKEDNIEIQNLKEEVGVLRQICLDNGFNPLVERSRSGNGAHLWIFFEKPIDASLARQFAFMLLDKGLTKYNIKTFQYYDRIYPSQDKTDKLGNLIALPLQGRAKKEGNSVFVDENWNAYYNQFETLFSTRRISEEEVKNFIINSQVEESNGTGVVFNLNKVRKKPWEKEDKFNREDVIEEVHIVNSNGLYIDSYNLMPRIQNQIRSMAAFSNPVYYKNLRLGFSNYNNSSSVYLGLDIDGYIRIPRGLKEELIKKLEESDIKYQIEEKRVIGRPIKVSFNGELKEEQKDAINDLLEYDNGVLNATTAFGKTVVSAYMIAKRKLSTLIVVNNTNLLSQWKDALNNFLVIDEQLPTYSTKTGRIKKRDEYIGILKGGKNTLSGIIDIVMDSSLVNCDDLSEVLDKYGMVIYDECHHASTSTDIKILENVKSKYVYGLTANLKRSDRLEKIVLMLLGPIRHKYSAMQRAIKQGIQHSVIHRFTNVIDIDKDLSINDLYNLVSESDTRNDMIIKDVVECVNNSRTPLVLTRFKKHAEYLYEKLKDKADEVEIIYGNNTLKENTIIRNKLKSIDKSKSIILIATSKIISEGFDFPRLDTLFITMPFSTDSALLEQSLGRINRDYEGKDEVIVYDYVDSHINVFNKMYYKRLNVYKKSAYVVQSNLSKKQDVGSIYSNEDYVEVYEEDLVEANKSIIVSCGYLYLLKVNRFIEIVKDRLEAGVKVIVIVSSNNLFVDDLSNIESISCLKKEGIKVIEKEDNFENYVIIDSDIVWYGNTNVLGKGDIYSSIMRIKDKGIGEEIVYRFNG